MNVNKYNGDDFYIPKDILGHDACEEYGTAPKYDGNCNVEVTESHEKYKAYYVTVHDATMTDYNGYVSKLEKYGFRLYHSGVAKKNCFSTYTDGYNIVNLSYVEYTDPLIEENKVNHYMVIAIDCVKNSELPSLTDNGQKITDVQVTMINSECSFLIRLEDGRFIYIDGGNSANYDRNNADIIFEQLMAQNVRKGKPVIAAWFITHAHADHVAGVIALGEKYGDRIKLQRMISNFPSELALSTCVGDEGPYTFRWATAAYDSLEKCFPNAKSVIAHIGQQYVFSGVTVDVLWTPENLYEKELHFSNESSTVFRVDMPTGRMMVVGDQHYVGCKIVHAMYEDELKSDVVQYAHHGFSGGDLKMYETIDAKYGIWTNCYENIVERGFYGKPQYNSIDPESPTVVLAMSNQDSVMVLRPDMTKEDIAKYIRFEE